MRVIAYRVTAMRRDDFRRAGHTFKLGVPTRVDASSLTTVQAEFLAASNPRDLLVERIYEAPVPALTPPAPSAKLDVPSAQHAHAPPKGRGSGR